MTEDLEWDPVEAVRRSQVIVILVHGVGAHSVTDMVDAAVRGHRATAGSNAVARRLELTDPAPIAGVWLEDGDSGISVVPVQWSDVRERLDRSPDARAMSDRFRIARAEWKTALASAKLASSAWWAGVAAASALMLIPALFIFVTGSLFVYAAGGALGLGWLLAAYEFRLPSGVIAPVAWAVTLFGSVAIVGLPALLDLVFDITRYVGDSHHRAAAASRFRGVITAVRQVAPGVPIIVAAHSLGSVLVTHALIDPEDDVPAPTLLVTMGSPLRTLSRVFGKAITPPAEAEPRLKTRHPECRWINMWRDADVIGRSLHTRGAQPLEEASLGDGAHEEYWSDPRFWQSGRRFLTNAPVEAALPLLAAAGFRSVTPEEANELSAKKRGAVLTLLTCAGASVVAGVWLYGYMPLRGMRDLFPYPLHLAAHALLLLAALGAAIAVVPGLALWSTDRELLARYRYWHAQRTAAAVAIAAATVSLAALAVWLVTSAT